MAGPPVTPAGAAAPEGTSPRGALSHLTVLDIGHHVAGPYCAKLLAGFGARVIKVERPGTGDPMRAVGPFHGDAPGRETSIPFLWLNTGKEGVTLNLKHDEGRRLFRELVQRADVVVENFSPRVMPGLGLDFEALRARHPRLIMTSISNFGQSGPWRDHAAAEITEYALGGSMAVTGDPDRPPLAAGPRVTQYTAALSAYVATLMAVFQRGASGRGQHVDVSIQESALDAIEINLVEYLHEGKVATRTGDEHPLVPWKLYPCADGYAAVIGGPVRRWLRAAPLFEEPRLLEPRYAHMRDRLRHRAEVDALLTPWLKRQTRRDVYHAGQSRGLAFGYVATLAEVMASPQHAARGYFEPTDHPEVGRHAYCGALFRPARTPWRPGRAPLLGEHTAAVYREVLGLGPEDLARLAREGVV